MKDRRHVSAVAAGLLSAGLFFLIYAFSSSILFMLMPAIPLLAIGLRWGLSPLSLAAFIGTLLVLIITMSPETTRFYLAFLVGPCLLFAPRALTQRDGKPFPVGEILTDLCIYAALVMVAMVLHFSAEGGLQAMVVDNIGKGLAEDPQMLAAVQAFAAQWMFLALGIIGCWWVLLLYAHGWLANLLLKNRGLACRESFALQPFTVSAWMLGLLAGAAALTFDSTPDVATAARMVCIIFLLPYYLLGISILLQRAETWKYRSVFMFLIYFFTLMLAWPALIVVGMGLWEQIKSFHPLEP